MKWRDRRRSTNVRKPSQSSQSSRGGGGFGFPTGGGRGIPIPMGGGIGGLIILLIILFLTRGGAGLFGPNSGIVQYDPGYQHSTEQAELENELEEFLAVVLADTEDVWHEVFKEEGMVYQEPTLVLYQGYVNTGCGAGSSDMGPFYCPADQAIYIDPNFYFELKDQFGAPGDFAFAYVLAHEVGHHVQYLLGITEQVFGLKAQISESEFNRILVRLELQADYFAGVFAHYVDNKNYLDPGDISEAMNAAAAVGDDTIQEKAWGMVVPDKFTHGSAEQRQRWFKKGYVEGNIKSGNTFDVSESELKHPGIYELSYPDKTRPLAA